MKKKRRLLQSDTFWGLAAALLVLLQFWWLPGEDGSAADSYSNTVDGKLGLYRTLSQLFPKVERDALRVVPRDASTLILIAPDRYPNSEEQQQLYEFVYNGGDLLFAPNWLRPTWDPEDGFREIAPSVNMPSLGIHLSYRAGSNQLIPSATTTPAPPAPGGQTAPTPPDPQDAPAEAEQMTQAKAGELNNEATNSDKSVKDGDGAAGVPGTPGNAGNTGPVAPAEEELPGDEIVASSNLVTEPVNYRSTAVLHLPGHMTTETLLTGPDGNPEAATWVLGYGRVVVCTSADMFSNRNMLYKSSRRLAVRLVEKCATNTETELELPESSIVINEYLNASDAFQNTGILLSPTLRIGTLQLLLVAVLGIWMSFHRFGPAQDVTTSHRRSLTESAQAVGNLQYRLNDGGAVIRGYLEYMNSQLRRRYGSLLRLDRPEQIASRAGMDTEEVRASLLEAQKMAESAQLSPTKAAGMLRWLARLQQRLSGNRSS